MFPDPSADQAGVFAPSTRRASRSDSRSRGRHRADTKQPKKAAIQRLKVVANSVVQEPQKRQSTKAHHVTALNSAQCAYSSYNTTPYPYHTDSDALGHPAANNHNTTATGKTRKTRRVSARLERVAIKKTWKGTKSKGYKDRMTEAEKFSAAVWQTAEAGGHAISLNLGIRREAMLTDHDDPRRRMMQNLSKNLRDAGFKDLPYQFVFELNPETEGGRLHLHGVIDTSGLTPDDLPRLRHALCRAASFASGAIGGERQLHMEPLHDPAGWTDYLLEYASRTAREMGIDHPFMRSNPMTRAAHEYFDEFRREVLDRVKQTSAKTTKNKAKPLKSNNLPVKDQFTSSQGSAIFKSSGERDAKTAGEGLERAVRQHSGSQKTGQFRASSPFDSNPRQIQTNPTTAAASDYQPSVSHLALRFVQTAECATDDQGRPHALVRLEQPCLG